MQIWMLHLDFALTQRALFRDLLGDSEKQILERNLMRTAKHAISWWQKKSSVTNHTFESFSPYSETAVSTTSWSSLNSFGASWRLIPFCFTISSHFALRLSASYLCDFRILIDRPLQTHRVGIGFLGWEVEGIQMLEFKTDGLVD